MVHAIYPGSFDPPTRGHMHILKTAAEKFEKLTVVVAKNPEKKCMFTPEERKLLLETICRNHKNVTVEVMGNQLLPHYAYQKGASVIVRCIRNVNDLAYEDIIKNSYQMMNEHIEIVHLQPRLELAHVSSSLVRSYLDYEGWEKEVRPYLDSFVFSAFLAKNARKLAVRGAWMQNALGLNLDMQKAHEIFEDLVMRYSEPHRAHHSLYHLTEMLGDLTSKSTNLPDDVRAQIHSHGSALFFAIFLHDAIYLPKAQDNEYQSMAYARDALATMGVSQPTIEEVSYLISTTNYFEVEPTVYQGHPLAAVLHDLDFGVLAKDKQRVFDYDEDIRLEYSNLSDTSFALGRLYYLRKYFTNPLFYSQLYTPEEQYRAKKNIALLLIERYNTLEFRNVEDTLP